MLRAHLVDDVRAAEQALMAQLPAGTLMQRAAAGLAARCTGLLGHVSGRRVVLLVGGGDNGGDTLYAGSRLARRGAQVRAVLVDPSRAHAAGLAALLAAGGRVAGDAEGEIARAHLVLDGIVGIGGTPGLRPAAQAVAAAARASGAVVVAVDLPSGVAVDTGEAAAPHVAADATVTFGTHKVCHLVDPAAAACGEVTLVDIGLGDLLPPAAVEALEPADVAALLPVPSRFDDKYRRGVLGLRTGAAEYAGAGVLAAAAATAGGVGMVRVTGEPAAAQLVRQRCPEVVLAEGQVQAWVAGPGMLPQDAASAVPPLLRDGVPVVLDAGALAALDGPLPVEGLITPHAGELARLLGRERDEVEAQRLASARQAAERWGVTVLLKGSTTLVVPVAGPSRATTTGTPALATAGSGDVLAGLAGALLAGGLSPLDAGSVAAHVHGLAGRLAAARVGYPTALDVLAAVPDALRRARLAESVP